MKTYVVIELSLLSDTSSPSHWSWELPCVLIVAPVTPAGSRPSKVKTRHKLRANRMICLRDPCLSTCSLYSTSPITLRPLLSATPNSWSRKRTRLAFKDFVPRSAMFHTVGSWQTWTSPARTCCCIHRIFPDTWRSFPTPCFAHSCRALDESVIKQWNTCEPVTNSKQRLM